MKKGTKIMMILWSILALSLFVSGLIITIPLFFKILNTIFGVFNIVAILGFGLLLKK